MNRNLLIVIIFMALLIAGCTQEKKAENKKDEVNQTVPLKNLTQETPPIQIQPPPEKINKTDINDEIFRDDIDKGIDDLNMINSLNLSKEIKPE